MDLTEKLKAVREKYQGRIIIWGDEKGYTVPFNEDFDRVKVLTGTNKRVFNEETMERYMRKLVTVGELVLICKQD